MNTLFSKFFIAILLLPFAYASGQARQFTYSERTNETVARKLNIPVYFAVPARARAPLPADIKIGFPLIDFKHPDGIGAKGDIGLRIVMARRAGLARELGRSGLVKTGDILLSFRTEWGGAGAYPNIQMGISHAGLAYIKNGRVHNLDNPLNEEYLGRGLQGRLDSEHYRTLDFMHVIRPRNLTDDQRERLYGWMTRLTSRAGKIYPTQIAFNQDYNDPIYSPSKPLNFVKQVGQMALGQDSSDKVSMFCSEFAWSVLALRDCDAKTAGDDFGKDGVPGCVKPIMTPLQATGNFVERRTNSSYVGLADGPMMVINALRLPDDKEQGLLRDVFIENPDKLSKMSSGHRKVAEEMRSKFGPLERYYRWSSSRGWRKATARFARAVFNRWVPDNYSPTSYLINTMLPPYHPDRKMDYVATIVIQ